MLIKRDIEDTIIKCSKEFACIIIYGARQVGKSTIALLFKEKGTVKTKCFSVPLSIDSYSFQ